MAGQGPDYLKQAEAWARIKKQLERNGGVLADPNPQGTAMGNALKGVSINPVGAEMAKQLQGVNLNKAAPATGEQSRRRKLPMTNGEKIEQTQKTA